MADIFAVIALTKVQPPSKLITAAASLVNITDPVKEAEKLTPENIETLKDRAKKWKDAADAIKDVHESLDATREDISLSWEGDGKVAFNKYMRELCKAIEAQEEACKQIDESLNELAKVFFEAEADLDALWTEYGMLIVGAIIGIIGGMMVANGFTGGLTGVALTTALKEAFITLLVSAIITLLWDLVAKLATRKAILDKQVNAVAKELEALRELASKNNLHEVTPPPAPKLNGPSLGSIEIHIGKQPGTATP
ncbi:WXG100 family type VII secretion target [Saccharopolyspora sp. 5N102]|uniref:WXG100 family type VII secretion target n=1 Tax=Saccharopolyspora sp. 5N102 TaxID=3375155 RepID=UPI0037912D21